MKCLNKVSHREGNPPLQAVESIILCFFKTINSFFSQKLLWIFLIILATKGLLTNAASIPKSEIRLQPEGQQLDLLSFLNRGEENTSFVTYETSKFNIQTFEISLEYVMEDLFYDLYSNCATIPMWKTVCDYAASSCQLADINIKTSENAMIILSQSLFSLSRVCELPDYPSSAIMSQWSKLTYQ